MFTLATVVPWGRTFDEYRRMFALTDADAAGRVLGCADGPASFNAEATRLGWRVTSCDPLYRCAAGEIRARIAATFDEVIDQTRRNAGEFVWGADIPSVDALARLRAGAMDAFLARSEEHTSELQSRFDLVCRLLLEKKKKKEMKMPSTH